MVSTARGAERCQLTITGSFPTGRKEWNEFLITRQPKYTKSTNIFSKYKSWGGVPLIGILFGHVWITVFCNIASTADNYCMRNCVAGVGHVVFIWTYTCHNVEVEKKRVRQVLPRVLISLYLICICLVAGSPSPWRGAHLPDFLCTVLDLNSGPLGPEFLCSPASATASFQGRTHNACNLFWTPYPFCNLVYVDLYFNQNGTVAQPLTLYVSPFKILCSKFSFEQYHHS